MTWIRVNRRVVHEYILYRPYEKCPWGRRDIGLFALGVNATGDRGYVQTKEEDVDDYVQDLGRSVIMRRDCNYRNMGNKTNNLEQNPVSPSVGHDGES